MDLNNIAIVGAGTMGGLLARWTLESGYTVAVCDQTEAALDKLKKHIGAIENMAKRLECTTNLEEAIAQAQLVIEAIPDRIEPKKGLLKKLDSICPESTILASCTAVIPIALLEEELERPDRCLVTNFWFDTPLVEVIRGTSTADWAVDAITKFADGLGKQPVLLTNDCPGHVCCRMFLGQVYRALRIIEAGVATAEDIDICMTLGSAYSSGILHRCDKMGLDFVYQAFLAMHEMVGEERFKPNRVLEEKVKAGKLGQKSGEGFFVWPTAQTGD